jgi:hypothetical protein
VLARARPARDFAVHTFDRQRLAGEYYSEGIGAGDLDRDGHVDVVYGPYWFAGPRFEEKHEIYPPKPQNREGYADHFFAWVYDFMTLAGTGSDQLIASAGSGDYRGATSPLAGGAPASHRHASEPRGSAGVFPPCVTRSRVDRS